MGKQILYNNRLLVWQMAQLGLTPGEVAAKCKPKISEFSVNRGLNGTLVSLTKLRPLADVLKVNWKFITNVDLPESDFGLAVLNGRSAGERGR
jgi:hypothetical protein